MRNVLLVSLLLLSYFSYSQNSRTTMLNSRTTILIGLDGFRWDILDRENVSTSNLREIRKNGVRSKLISRIPSLSFPNLYTLVTGLNPENSGIVSNETYLPKENTFFSNKSFKESKWFQGEPIWVTAEKHKITTATMFWIGSDAKIKGFSPTYSHEFNVKKWNPNSRAQEVLRWLSLEENKPEFITLYFDEVDNASQDFGIGSDEEKKAIEVVDEAIGILIKGLKEKGLWERINIVVVADHGMTETSQDKVIYLDDYINTKSLDVFAFNNHPYFTFSDANCVNNCDSIYSKLKIAHPKLQVYKREDLPKRFHRKNSDRLGDLSLHPDLGWVVTTHQLFNETLKGKPFSNNEITYNGGFMKAIHGYDSKYEDMYGIFLAMGPYIKKGTEIEPFDNINVYSLLCKMLKIKPAKNDGSIKVFEKIVTY